MLVKKPTMLSASLRPTDSHAGTCEQLLSKRALAAASQILGTPHLIAGIPKRDCLLITPGKPGEFQQMMKMQQAVSGVYSRAGDKAVSDYCFFARDGELIGANVLEGSSGYLHMSDAPSSWLTAA